MSLPLRPTEPHSAATAASAAPVLPPVASTPRPIAPPWFLGVVALCLVALTVAGVVRLRYAPWGNGAIFDAWQRALCNVDHCVRISRTVVPIDTALHRRYDYPAGTRPPALP